jgi:hypothetical protein
LLSAFNSVSIVWLEKRSSHWLYIAAATVIVLACWLPAIGIYDVSFSSSDDKNLLLAFAVGAIFSGMFVIDLASAVLGFAQSCNLPTQ